MHTIASSIAIVGLSVVRANAFPAFRGNTNRDFTTFNMFEKASPAVFDDSPLFTMSKEDMGGIQQEAEITIDVNYANGTSIPSDQIKVDISYDDDTVGVTDQEETTVAVDDDMTTTTSVDDDEITTPAPEDQDDEEMTEETAYILSDSTTNNNRKLQAVGIQQEAEITIDINYANGTSIPSDQIKVDITYDDDTVGVTDQEETTVAVDDDMTTTTSVDDDEITTPAPEDQDDEEVTEESAYILSESNTNRNLQAEVIGVVPPVVLPPVAPIPGAPPVVLPPVIVVDVDYDDDEDVVTTEAPEEPITEATDDEDVTTAEPTEEIPTVLPGGPFRPIIDIITRPTGRPTGLPTRRPRTTTVAPSTVEPTTRRPLFPFTTTTTLAPTQPPTIIVVEEPAEVIVEPTAEQPTPEEPTAEEPAKEDPSVQEPSEAVDDSEENSFIRFLPSWLRPSQA